MLFLLGTWTVYLELVQGLVQGLFKVYLKWLWGLLGAGFKFVQTCFESFECFCSSCITVLKSRV